MDKDQVVKGVGIARKGLGWLTDSKLNLPGWLRKILGIGRAVGAWDQKPGSGSGLGGGPSVGPGQR